MSTGDSATFDRYGNGSQTLIFAHANGFPAASYAQLLQGLGAEYTVLAPAFRPLWQPLEEFYRHYRSKHLWQCMAQDQIAFMEQHCSAPVTYIGHSMGAVVGLMAANQRPDLFHQLVMIEPVFLPEASIYAMHWLPRPLKRHIPIVKKALGRPDHWPNMQMAFDFHRRKRVFSRFSDQALWDYINSAVGLGELSTGTIEAKLQYDKYWEALAYATVPNTWPLLRSTQVPMYLLRAQNSDTVSQASLQRWYKLPGPKHAIEFDHVGHLLPLEQPQRVVSALLPILAKKSP